jgi:hypothetical protein
VRLEDQGRHAASVNRGLRRGKHVASARRQYSALVEKANFIVITRVALVKVRSKRADNWRDSYVVIEPAMRRPWPGG